jgi:hypothetical protein
MKGAYFNLLGKGLKRKLPPDNVEQVHSNVARGCSFLICNNYLELEA